MGMIADAMRAQLRQVAESDAKALRATEQLLAKTNALLGERDNAVALLAGSREDEIAAAIELLQSAGYTVTPPTA